jgi:hypothetical protein
MLKEFVETLHFEQHLPKESDILIFKIFVKKKLPYQYFSESFFTLTMKI